MPRSVNKLSHVRVKAIRDPGRYSDGDGLYLYLSAAGNKSWVFRYRDRVSGKLRDKGLGPARLVSLEQARQLARSVRAQLHAGVDPIDAERLQRDEAKRRLLFGATFGKCADGYITAHSAEWRNAKHRAQWRATLNTYASGLSDRPVDQIDTQAVVAVLEPIWASKTETATRVRQRIEAVLDWAAARKYRQGDNPARWNGHLDHLLANPSKLKNVKPRAALAYQAAPTFYARLAKDSSISALALRFQILTATRPSEASQASWKEIDLENQTWTIPGERMKAGRPHRIPLSKEATKLLSSMGRLEQWVFPGARGRPLTTAAPLKVLRRLQPGVTAHGFRSTFRDWAADMTPHPREVVEQALAHALENKTEAAYLRTDLFAKRALLMAHWAEFLRATGDHC